jgi:hypothetical protein
MSPNTNNSPADQVMDEAIDLALEGRSPFPDKSAFIDADTAHAGHEIRRAADEGRAVVLVAADGTTRLRGSPVPIEQFGLNFGAIKQTVPVAGGEPKVGCWSVKENKAC